MRHGRYVPVLLVAALCAILVSCNSDQLSADSTSAVSTQTAAQTETPAGGYALNFRITWKSYSGRGEAIQAIVDAFNGQSSGALVTLTDGDEDLEAVETMLSENRNTVYVLPYRFIQYFGSKGYLADLTEAFAQERGLFYDAVWALASVNGTVYGIPWLGHSMCLLYNKDLLKRAGVDAGSITSMESLISAMETIEETTGVKGLGLVGAESNDVSWMVNQFIYGFGSGLVSSDGKTVVINNEQSIEALRTYRDVLGPHAQPTWRNDTAVEVQTAFRNQEIAFEILGIWGVTDILKNGSPFEVGILPMTNIGLYSEVGPMMLAIPTSMDEQGKEAAYAFIRYMISTEAQEEIMKGEYSPEHDTYYPFRMPIRFDMADSPIFQAHPEYQAFIEGFKTPSIDVPVPAWQTIKDEVYAPGLHLVMMGEMTIEAFLSEVEQKGNQILQGQ